MGMKNLIQIIKCLLGIHDLELINTLESNIVNGFNEKVIKTKIYYISKCKYCGKIKIKQLIIDMK